MGFVGIVAFHVLKSLATDLLPFEKVDQDCRAYLKLAISHCKEAGIMEQKIDKVDVDKLPFSLMSIPQNFPQANELRLWIIPF